MKNIPPAITKAAIALALAILAALSAYLENERQTLKEETTVLQTELVSTQEERDQAKLEADTLSTVLTQFQADVKKTSTPAAAIKRAIENAEIEAEAAEREREGAAQQPHPLLPPPNPEAPEQPPSQ